MYREADGTWRHHNGPLPSLLGQMPEQTQEPARPFGSSALIDPSHGAPSSPIEHAFQNQYQFALRAVGAGTPQRSIPIDPALLPLPGGTDLDLRDPSIVAEARGLKAADKVAGSRRNGKERADPKGKKRKHISSDSEDDGKVAPKRGRPAGSGNYGTDGTKKLLDLVQELLPVGQKGWKLVERAYNKWAVHCGKSKRSQSSLEHKYKGYLKMKKPTGSATCPPEVKRAHEIEDLINQRVGTRDLSDSEFDSDSEAGASDNDIEIIEHPSASIRTAVAQRVPTPPLRRKSRATGTTDLANKLAHAFDPEAQKARDDARAQRTFENTQILTLSQQLRDAQGVAESLRTQNGILQNRVHDLERAHDRAELKLELLGMTGGGGGVANRGRSRRRSPPRRSHKNEPGLQRVRGKIRCERLYPDGGAMTYWASDPSTDDDDYWKSDRENEPYPYETFQEYKPRSRSHTTTSHRPISRRRTPTPGPSRPRDPPSTAPTFFGRQPSISPSRPTVTGNAVELVVTPRRGPAMALVISPAAPKN